MRRKLNKTHVNLLTNVESASQSTFVVNFVNLIGNPLRIWTFFRTTYRSAGDPHFSRHDNRSISPTEKKISKNSKISKFEFRTVYHNRDDKWRTLHVRFKKISSFNCRPCLLRTCLLIVVLNSN